MTFCDDGHEEICFDGRNCPLCDVIFERDQLASKVSDLQNNIEELERTAQEEK